MQVTIINRGHGAIKVHKPGCKDLKKDARGASIWDADVDSMKELAWDVYPPEDFDYDAETEWQSYCGDIELANCCPKLGDVAPAKARQARRPQLNHRTQCTHPQTPEARRTCRKAHWAGVAIQAAAGVKPADQPQGPKLEVFPARGQGRSKASRKN